MIDNAALCAELPTLRRLANIWMGQDAEDLLQATCEKALRNTAQFHGGNLQAWLVTIMRTARLDMARGASYRVTSPIEAAEHVGTPAAQESAVALRQAIATLGKDSMLLPSAYGYSGDEIAAYFHTTRQHVQKHIFDERRTFNDQRQRS